jgi:hypothetical protein
MQIFLSRFLEDAYDANALNYKHGLLQCVVATREKTTFLCPRIYVLFTLHTLLNAVICCSQLNTQGVLG